MITIKNEEELAKMRGACQLTALAIEAVKKAVKPGITTRELDEIARKCIEAHGGVPSCLGYMDYPATTCISINNVLIHGIPDDTKVKEGDLVSVDICAGLNGFIGDATRSFVVGEPTPLQARLLEVTEEAFFEGLKFARVGYKLKDISHAVQVYVEKNGFSVVREYTGHGIGREMHESPLVPNYGMAGTGPSLRAGMTLAVEPMVNAGTAKVRTLSDGWTVVTADNSLACHYENTIAITNGAPEVMTYLPDERKRDV